MLMMLCTEMKIQCSLYPARLSRTYTHTDRDADTQIRSHERKKKPTRTHTHLMKSYWESFFSLPKTLFLSWWRALFLVNLFILKVREFSGIKTGLTLKKKEQFLRRFVWSRRKTRLQTNSKQTKRWWVWTE